MTQNSKTIQEVANDAVATGVAEWDAAHRVTSPNLEQQAEQRVKEARFHQLITEHALLCDVRPASVRFVLRDAEAVFELRADALVARNNATDPSDPVSPLTPVRWLQDLRASEPYLFVAPRQAH